MNSDHLLNRHEHLPFFFQRRNERLDWRKIASFDVEKVVQDGDTKQLDEYITPILFCRADSEFDENKTDPGFIKVFKLCQLIGEYLIHSHEKDKEKLTSCEKKCAHVEELKGKVDQELGQTRECLTLAKKELKKTKDILAVTQTQLLGSDNLDEVDQCPYCTKYFLTPSLLLAHLQRRHQGLPIPHSLQQHSAANIAMFPLPLQMHNQHQPLGSCSTILSSKVGGGMGATAPTTYGTPTVYAFTLSPDGTVTKSQNHTNLNLSNISPTSSNNLEKRRDSATQTVNAMKIKESSSEEDDHQNANRRPPSEFSKTTKCNSDSDPALVKVIKSPCGNTNEDSDSEKEEQHQRNKSGDATSSLIQIQPLGVGVDLNTICDLVEKYLEQKSIASQNQHYDKILKSIHDNMDQFPEFVGVKNRPIFQSQVQIQEDSRVGLERKSLDSSSPSPAGRVELTQSDINVGAKNKESVVNGDGGDESRKDFELNVMRMRDDFESQWTHLSEKVLDSGIQELRQAFLTEIKKVQEMILNSPQPQPKPQQLETNIGLEIGPPLEKDATLVGTDCRAKVHDNNVSVVVVPASADGDKELKVGPNHSPPEAATINDQFHKLSLEIQSKMKLEMEELQRKLESQDEYWRSQLHLIKQEHELQIEMLHKDFESWTKAEGGEEKMHSQNSTNRPMSAKSHIYQSTESDDHINQTTLQQQRQNVGGPIAKPRKFREEDASQPPTFTKSPMQVGNRKGNSTTIPFNKYGENVHGRGESISITGDNHRINQESSQMYPHPQERDVDEDVDQDQGLISTDPDAENEYLTIIHADGGDVEYLDDSEAVRAIHKTTTTAPSPTFGSNKVKAITGCGIMGSKPPIHKHQEQLNVPSIDQVSDYTLSTSAEEHLRGIDGNSQSEDDGESLANDADDNDDDNNGPREKGGGGECAEGVTTKRKVKVRTSPPKKKYVFDPAQGKIIDACETRSQMDLVRDRIVLTELDTQMENLGLNPEASSLGLEEMARALKHLKTDRLLMDEGQHFQDELISLRKNVKYEVAKKSLAQKWEMYRKPSTKPESTRFFNILSKVKKSGSSWRQKVTSAIKRKQKKSPSNKSKEIEEAKDVKTTFFSKWGRKKNKTGKENTTQAINSCDESHSSNESESSSDVEMHPYMTRSQPILTRESSRERSGRRNHKKTNGECNSSEDESDDSVKIGPPPKYQKKQYQPKPKPRRAKAPPPPLPNSTSNPNALHLRGQLISELKAKFGDGDQERQPKFSSPSSPLANKTIYRPSSSSSPRKYNGPNFFVSGSTTTLNRTGNIGERSPGSVKRMGNGSSLRMDDSSKRGNIFITEGESRRGIPNINSNKTPTRFPNPAASAHDGPRKKGDSQLGQEQQGKIGGGFATSALDPIPTPPNKPLIMRMQQHQQQSFTRSDGMRKGFRRKSSLSLSEEEEDGHEIRKNVLVFF